MLCYLQMGKQLSIDNLDFHCEKRKDNLDSFRGGARRKVKRGHLDILKKL